MYRDLPEPSIDLAAPAAAMASASAPGAPASIGELIRRHRDLSAEQVERILAHQREHDMRFGEAAVALKLANEDDVVRALALQFDYPVSAGRPGNFAPELVVVHRPFSPQAEIFRGIRAQLLMRLFGRQMPRRAIAVVSPDAGDGRSYFAANLAAAFSQLGGRTLLVDADLRVPRLHKLFGVDNSNGLSSLLIGQGGSRSVAPVALLPSLFVLPVGAVPPNPMELIERPVFGQLMADMLQKFDHVVVDTPAFTHGMDAPVIASKCGAALVVARRDRSHFAGVQDLVATLSESPAELAGVVINEH